MPGRRKTAQSELSSVRHRSTKVSSDDHFSEITCSDNGVISAKNYLDEPENYAELLLEGQHEADNGEGFIEPLPIQNQVVSQAQDPAFAGTPQGMTNPNVQVNVAPVVQQQNPQALDSGYHAVAPMQNQNQNQIPMNPNSNGLVYNQQQPATGLAGPQKSALRGPPPRGYSSAYSDYKKRKAERGNWGKSSGGDRMLMSCGAAVIITIIVFASYYLCIGIHHGDEAMNDAINHDLNGGPSHADKQVMQAQENQTTRIVACITEFVCGFFLFYVFYELINLCCTKTCGIRWCCYMSCLASHCYCECCGCKCGGTAEGWNA